MSNLRTYFAIVKVYMVINILLTPQSFTNGGYLLSPLAVTLGFMIEAMSSFRLVGVALETGIFSYPLLM